MATSIILTAELVRKLVRYEPDTGRLFWLERPAELFSSRWPGQEQATADYWNRRNAGRECFLGEDEDGYRIGSIFDLTRKAHRVAWAIQTGSWPTTQIDHRNGVRNDNRWANLRLATEVQNRRNSAPELARASDFKGVTWHKRDQVWFTRIYVDGQRIQLGTFDDEVAAARAYDEAARQHFGEFAKLNFPTAWAFAR